ncbi:MAG: RsmD family RNA methyltransferase [Planctomycetes bacterium]|nr:RsmD family RNA methyltransferase [Planctomycetota bacterium]
MRIIAGEARGRRITAPGDRSVRPLLDRIRESLFARLGDLEGVEVLDLFAGAGTFGLEALSRGARRATFVEKSRDTLSVLRRNVESLGFQGRCETLQGDALRVPDLEAVGPPGFGVVWLDPPFIMFDRPEAAERVFLRVQEILQSSALEPGGRVLLRHPTRFRGMRPLAAADERKYGESVVLTFVR